jgi:hypothetical protein
MTSAPPGRLNMARRLAAIVLMEPPLNANYLKAKKSNYTCF